MTCAAAAGATCSRRPPPTPSPSCLHGVTQTLQACTPFRRGSSPVQDRTARGGRPGPLLSSLRLCHRETEPRSFGLCLGRGRGGRVGGWGAPSPRPHRPANPQVRRVISERVVQLSTDAGWGGRCSQAGLCIGDPPVSGIAIEPQFPGQCQAPLPSPWTPIPTPRGGSRMVCQQPALRQGPSPPCWATSGSHSASLCLHSCGGGLVALTWTARLGTEGGKPPEAAVISDPHEAVAPWL